MNFENVLIFCSHFNHFSNKQKIFMQKPRKKEEEEKDQVNKNHNNNSKN